MGTIWVWGIMSGVCSLFLSAGKRQKPKRGSTADAGEKRNLLAVDDTSGQPPEWC